jgi:4-alpha-glucanotransferase
MTALTELAEAAGLMPHWRDFRNEPKEVSEDSLRAVLAALGLPAGSDAEIRESREQLAQHEAALPPLVTAVEGEPIPLPGARGNYELAFEDGSGTDGRCEGTLRPISEPGYHLLQIEGQQTMLAVAPRRAFTIRPESRPWALAVQLYGLRRDGDGGLGDFEALRELVGPAARHGAAGIAISPVHAQFSADRDRFSPYSPSSRINLNVLHAPVTLDTPQGDFVDWPEAGKRRLDTLRQEFERLPDRSGLDRFRASMGDALETHARFEVLHAAQFAEGHWHWRDWPAELRDPRSPAVADFARLHADEVAFHAYAQWRADQGLNEAQRAAKQAGMAIGIIADLAVGADSGGSHCWARQEETLIGLSIGAPPDLLSEKGQSWGLAAFSPHGLRRNGFGAFLEMLRAAMRHAGGVRIDHALGLRRLWVVPDGMEAKDGAYLAFPQTDLLRLIALESQRHRSIVLGEDLGTIPEGFQDELADAGILGMRVLWFERDNERFTQPRTWTRAAAAMTSTHDLPTVAGWWAGKDLEWRAKLGLTATPEKDGEERFQDRFRLWDAMRESGAAQGDPPPPEDGDPVADAATRHVASAACDLAIIPIEDVLALPEQPNLPGTMGDQHPNWRRRLPLSADTLLDEPAVAARLAGINDARKQ